MLEHLPQYVIRLLVLVRLIEAFDHHLLVQIHVDSDIGKDTSLSGREEWQKHWLL